MKKILIIIFISLLILPYLYSYESKEVYPWKTIDLSPSFSCMYLSSQSRHISGQGVITGLQVADLYDGFLLGLNMGYVFFDTEHEYFTPIPLLAFDGGYSFPLNNYMSAGPYIGYSLYYPVEDFSIGFDRVLSLGVEFNLHLYNRNFLTLNSSYNAAFGSYDFLSFKAGLKHDVPVMMKMRKPDLNLGLSPVVFSPDSDGKDDILYIELDTSHKRAIDEWFVTVSDYTGSPIAFWGGDGPPPEQIEWGGQSYSGNLVFSASDYYVSAVLIDKLGNETTVHKPFITDIFVQEVNGIAKIRIPNIVFSPGKADFSTLEEHEINRNSEIINKLTDFLKKFPEYHIVIEGHGNIIAWKDKILAEKEQEEELIPLSLDRARLIKTILIEKGINAERLDVAGKGGGEPLVAFSDESNRWMNRRVEFILIK